MDNSLGFENLELKFICYLDFEFWNFFDHLSDFKQ
jgi:hypothetical protein